MSAILWTDADSGSLLAWAGQRLATLFPRRARKSSKAVSEGEAPVFYATTFRAPLKRRADFRKAAEHALPQLMPVSPQDLLIYGRQGTEGVELAAVRRADMQAWWKASGSRQPDRPVRISDTWSILPPETAKVAIRRRMAFAAATILALAGAIALYVTYMSFLDGRLADLRLREQQVRSAALAFARQQEEANLWGSLESTRASARLPAAVLSSVAELSRALPAEAMWTRIEWTPVKMTMAGMAADPVATLAALSHIKGARATFSKPVTGKGEGKQEYEILITFGEAPK